MIDRFISHIYFGVTVIILHSIEFRKLQTLNSDPTLGCNCTWVKPLQMANCSGTQRVSKVPGDCGKHVKRLDLSEMMFEMTENFNGITFENYANLQQLYMKRIKRLPYVCKDRKPPICPIVFKKDVFLPLTSLEVLDLSEIDAFIIEASTKWPPKLRILHLTGSKLAEIPSMAYLEHFTEFNGAKNGFRKFPEFNSLVSVINHIELLDNPLDDLNVSQIAPLCSLNYLGIRVTADGKFSRPSKYCSCIRLRKWMKDRNIAGFDYLNCNNGGGTLTEKSCTGKVDMSFSAELEDYNDCLHSGAGTSLWELLVFAVFFSILFPVLYFANEAYNNYFSEPKAFSSKGTSKLGHSSPKKSHRGSITDHDHEHDDHDYDHDDDDDHEHDDHRRESYADANV